MQLCLLVIVNAHEEYVASVFGYLRGIFLALYLVEGGVGRVIEFQLATPTSSSLGIAGASSAILSLVRQFNDEGGLGDVAARNHYEVGIPLARSVLTVDDILILRPYIGYGQHTGKRVLVIIGENARVLVVGKVDGTCHGLLVAGYGGGEKVSVDYHTMRYIFVCAVEMSLRKPLAQSEVRSFRAV